MEPNARIARSVEEHRRELIELSHDVHSHPEINFEENYSSQRVSSVLESNGFAVAAGVADLPTAFRATFGSGSLNIGLCAEYDALPNVGHACGHNIICSAAVGAGLALAPLAEELDLTVTVLGTPAEEGGGGKVFMLQRGAFDGLHASLMIHPAPIERVEMATLATTQLEVTYFGRAAHAAAAPHRGISASAALALAQSGIAMLREHFETDDRVHGVVTNGGGVPNVVPAEASGRWFVRGATIDRKNALEQRVLDIFRGAALMTGCRLEVRRTAPSFSEVVTDVRLSELWRENASSLGRESLSIQPTDGLASTDMGNVSYAMPSIHPLIAVESNGANIHEPEFAQAATSVSGDRAVIDGAVLLAQTVVSIAADKQLRGQLVSRPYVVEQEDSNAAYLGNSWDETVSFDPAG